MLFEGLIIEHFTMCFLDSTIGEHETRLIFSSKFVFSCSQQTFYIGPMSGWYTFQDHIGPTYAFYLGPISVGDALPTFSFRPNIGCATRLNVEPMSAAYQTTISVWWRAALHFHISLTYAFYLGPVSEGDNFPTFPIPLFNPSWTSIHTYKNIYIYYTHMYIPTYLYTYICIYAHIHTYIIHTYVYMYMCDKFICVTIWNNIHLELQIWVCFQSS